MVSLWLGLTARRVKSHVAVSSELVALSGETLADSTRNSGSWGRRTTQEMREMMDMTANTATEAMMMRQRTALEGYIVGTKAIRFAQLFRVTIAKDSLRNPLVLV
jgi:hypothetical protein